MRQGVILSNTSLCYLNSTKLGRLWCMMSSDAEVKRISFFMFWAKNRTGNMRQGSILSIATLTALVAKS